MKRVAIIGGGLTGLSTAYYLAQAQPLWHIDLYEKEDHFGGKIQTKRVDGYVVETGPDSYLARKTELTELIQELGLGHTIVSNATGQAYIYDRDRMYPIPGGSIVGIPTEFVPFAISPLISWRGKVRAGMDIFKAPYPVEGDISIGHFFQYHLGKEMVDKLIEPLLSGIYGGDIYSLSLDATFPNFHQLEKKYGNMIKGMLALKRRQSEVSASDKKHASKGMFRQVTGGLISIIDALIHKMPKNVTLHQSQEIISIERTTQNTYHMVVRTYNSTVTNTEDNQSTMNVLDAKADSMDKNIEMDSLIITTPPQAYKHWFNDDRAFDELSSMAQSSCAIAVMAFNANDFDIPLDGTGFVITRKTKTPLTACTYITKKWPQTAPDDKVVLRVFLGKPGDATVQNLSKHELGQLALTEIRRIMGFTAEPLWIEVMQLIDSMPQYVVGHRELVHRIQTHVDRTYPDLYLIGTPFDGIGMPDGVKQARELVDKISTSL